MNDDYLQVVFNNSQEENTDLHEKQEKALKCALEIRKFEINLYWKRATYFWAFIAAIFASFFILIFFLVFS